MARKISCVTRPHTGLGTLPFKEKSDNLGSPCVSNLNLIPFIPVSGPHSDCLLAFEWRRRFLTEIGRLLSGINILIKCLSKLNALHIGMGVSSM